jgi:hypothetical protein
MRSVISLVGGVALLCCSITSHAQAGSEWDGLKLYRTYHYVMDKTERAHHFDVWFNDGYPHHCSVAGNTPDEIMASGVRCLWGWFGSPPVGVPPVPDDVSHLADAVVDRIAEHSPGASNIVVAYSGDFSTIEIGATTPITSDGSLFLFSELRFSVFADPPELRPYGRQITSGLTGTPPPAEELCDTAPCFIDLVMPPEIEGSGLAYAHYWGAGGPYEPAWRDFVSAVLATADTIDQGTYVNPISSILSAQGDTLLPPDLNQFADYEIRTYLRGSDERETIKLKFPVSKSASGPVTRSRISQKTGIFYQATLDLGTRSVTTMVLTPTGERQELTVPISVELIHDGDVVAIDGHPHLDLPWEEGKMVFEGFGDHTRIYVYLDSFQGARVFLPLPQQPYYEVLPIPELR